MPTDPNINAFPLPFGSEGDPGLTKRELLAGIYTGAVYWINLEPYLPGV